MITLSRPNFILGGITAIILSTGVSVVFYYALKKIGQDYLLIKSIGISLYSWLVLEVIFMWLIEGRNLIPLRPISDIIHSFSVRFCL